MLNFLVSSWVKDQVSEPYIATGSINVLHNCSSNFVEMSLHDHKLFFSLLKTELAIAILLFTSNDEFETTDSKNLNFQQFLYFHFLL